MTHSIQHHMKHRSLSIGETPETYAVIIVRHVGNSTKLIPRNDREIHGISCFLEPFISLKVCRQNMPQMERGYSCSRTFTRLFGRNTCWCFTLCNFHRRINSATICRPNPISSARYSLTDVLNGVSLQRLPFLASN